jgi:hypothetical protein
MGTARDSTVPTPCITFSFLQYFHKTFSLYELLFTVLRNDSVYLQQPDKLRHPLIFYWGHTVSLCRRVFVAVFYQNENTLTLLFVGSISLRIFFFQAAFYINKLMLSKCITERSGLWY